MMCGADCTKNLTPVMHVNQWSWAISARRTGGNFNRTEQERHNEIERKVKYVVDEPIGAVIETHNANHNT